MTEIEIKQLIKEYKQTEKEYSELKIKNHDYAIWATDKIAELEAENSELKGYKHVVDTLKAEGFDTVMFVKQELKRYKEYRLKVANEEIALDMEIESRR